LIPEQKPILDYAKRPARRSLLALPLLRASTWVLFYSGAALWMLIVYGIYFVCERLRR